MLGAFGDENTTFGDTDFSWFGILVGTSAGLGGGVGLVLVAVIGAALLFAAIQMQRKVVATGWDPAPGRERPAASGPEPGPGDEASGSAKRYAKIPPPAGAPVPPPPPEG